MFESDWADHSGLNSKKMGIPQRLLLIKLADLEKQVDEM